MKVAGVVLLATLVIYKDLNGKPFHTSWWGILGLIGWTYAVCAGIYLFTRESLRKNAVAWFAVITLAVISHSGLIPEEYGSVSCCCLSFPVTGRCTHSECRAC